MGGSPRILAHEDSDGATARNSTPVRKETFLSELTEHGSLIYLSSMCSLLHSRTSQAEVSWGAEKSLVEGAKQQSGQTLGLEGPPQSNRRREEGTGIWCPQARRLPGSKERERQTERQTERVPSGPVPWGPLLGSLTAKMCLL